MSQTSYRCVSCNRSHRTDSAIGKAHAPTDKPAKMLPDVCPVDGGVLYQFTNSRYCPNEDTHRGGLLIGNDGTVHQWSINRVSSTEEGSP